MINGVKSLFELIRCGFDDEISIARTGGDNTVLYNDHTQQMGSTCHMSNPNKIFEVHERWGLDDVRAC